LADLRYSIQNGESVSIEEIGSDGRFVCGMGRQDGYVQILLESADDGQDRPKQLALFLKGFHREVAVQPGKEGLHLLSALRRRHDRKVPPARLLQEVSGARSQGSQLLEVAAKDHVSFS